MAEPARKLLTLEEFFAYDDPDGRDELIGAKPTRPCRGNHFNP